MSPKSSSSIDDSGEPRRTSDAPPKSGEFYKGRLWFERKGSMLTLGLTSVAIEELGSIESISFPGEGEDFGKDEAVVTVEGTHGKLEVITPASGVIEEINEAAKDECEIVSDDPLEEGWLVKLEIEDPTELRELVGGEDGSD